MTVIPDDTPHQVAAFMRKIEREIKQTSPSFVLVVMDGDGRPHVLSRANRTGLVIAGIEAMQTAIHLEKADPCACADCDGWTARARTALAAVGVATEPLN